MIAFDKMTFFVFDSLENLTPSSPLPGSPLKMPHLHPHTQTLYSSHSYASDGYDSKRSITFT
jgi:hypothetical protein